MFWLPDYLSQGRGFSLQEIGFYGWIPYLTVEGGLPGFVGVVNIDRDRKESE